MQPSKTVRQKSCAPWKRIFLSTLHQAWIPAALCRSDWNLDAREPGLQCCVSRTGTIQDLDLSLRIRGEAGGTSLNFIFMSSEQCCVLPLWHLEMIYWNYKTYFSFKFQLWLWLLFRIMQDKNHI